MRLTSNHIQLNAVGWMLTGLCSLAFAGCSNFNARINRLDRVIVVGGTGQFFEPFAVNLTTGALTSQGRVTTTITPTRVATGRSNSVILVSDTSSVLCYRYDTRLGGGPALESTTSIPNLSSMKIAPDDLTLVYSKTGSASLFWRTLDKCNLGSEQSVGLSGSTGDQVFAIAETGNLVFALESGGSAVWKVTRNTATGALSSVSSVAASVCPSTPTAVSISPDGAYGFFCGTAPELSVIRFSTLSISSLAVGTTVDIVIPTEATKGVMLLQGDAHQGFTLNSSGAPSLSGSATFSIPDLRYGVIINPDRTFAYVGGPISTSLWINRISTTAPYVSSVTSSVIGFAPMGFDYLPGYSR